ncbi:hypothetical protein C0216_32445 (plasmid) [Streptomyces globosus]|uniref:Hint domain-containing protein n=1 Tax=Streptomyces globosus TaxID=68209 RepID=A0A344UBR9_9ACTN|nr:hypothetical protein C0216_32445 [Streptomyces globosus]
MREGGKLTYLFADHHGTGTIQVTGDAAQTVTRRKTGIFGEARGPQPESWAGDKGFVGGTKDTDTGLTHLGAREYDPLTGRFISVDPIMDLSSSQQMHGYVYSSNNPVTLSDPSGLIETDCLNGHCDGNYDPRDDKKPADDPTRKKGITGSYDSYNRYRAPTALEDNYGLSIRLPKEQKQLFIQIYIQQYVKQTLRFGRSYGFSEQDDWIIKTQAMINACQEIKCAELRDYVIQHGLAVEAVYGPFEGRNINVRATPRAMPANYRKISTEKVTGCQCFLAGTKVEMADGTTKSIEDVQLGDEVRATDPRSGETGKRPVTRLIVTENDKHFNKLSIATPEGITELTATYEHPFWSPSENAWLDAADLRPGMTLQTSDGTTAILTANHPFTQHAKTYNLTVADLHTYYVLAGGTPVLVHNANCGPAEYYRGAKDGQPSFVPRPNDYKVDAETGFVKETHGVSLFDNPTSISSRGFRPHGIDTASMPSTLRVIQRGKDPRHHEIVPAPGANLTPARYAEELSKIRCICGGGG